MRKLSDLEQIRYRAARMHEIANPDFEALLRRLTPGAEFRITSYMNTENRPALSITVDGKTYEFVAVGDNLVRLPTKPPTQAVTIPGFDAFLAMSGQR